MENRPTSENEKEKVRKKKYRVKQNTCRRTWFDEEKEAASSRD